jgi:predicted transcriptional regulator
MLWAELFESSTDAAIRENARINLELLRADEDIEHVNEIAQRFAAKTGRLARNVREMMQIGLIGGEPVDPTGHAYVIGSDGKAHISEDSPLFKESSVYRRGL